MASSQSPNRVFFSNLDRSVNDTTTDFTITFDTPITNSYNYEVVSASFPNLMTPFASYETILYFYHDSFNNGNIAIAVPMSITQVGGAGETAPPAGRDTYIDKRYFADGTELATYLTAWLTSLSTSWPTQASGLQPFYYTGDQPIDGVRTYFANEAATGVTFSNLSFAFDDLTANGTLKMTFADSGPEIVRIASVLDFGSLEDGTPLPSRMGFKLGFTDQVNEAFGNVVSFTTANNQLGLTVATTQGYTTSLQLVIPPNDYSAAGLVLALNNSIVQAYTRLGNPEIWGGTSVAESSDILTFTFPTPAAVYNVSSFRIAFPAVGSARINLGFTSGDPSVVPPGGTITAPSAINLGGQTPVPDQHIALSTINLIRTSSVFMASSLSSGESMTSQGRKDVLFAIPVSAGVGAIQQYQSSLSGIVINRPPNAIRNLRLTMLDDLFQVLEPLPPNASVNVEIHFAYREDAKASQLDFRSTNLYA